MSRTLLTLFLLASLASSAQAAPSPSVWERLPAAADALMPYQFNGELGATGLVVASSPTSLNVTRIVPGSVADMAGLPQLEHCRLCLAAVDGIPTKRLTLRALRERFSPGREAVALTFSKSRDGGPEVFCGPYRLPLSPIAVAERRTEYYADAGRFDQAEQAAAGHPAALASLAPRLVLAAQEAATAGDYPRAIKLASQLPDGLTLEKRAEGLTSQWASKRSEQALIQASQLACAGRYDAALATLQATPMAGRYAVLSAGEERDYRAALALRHHKLPAQPAEHQAAPQVAPSARAQTETQRPSPAAHVVAHAAVHHIAIERAALHQEAR